MRFLPLLPAFLRNHAAGDFPAGITGGLRHEIVRPLMDHDRSPFDLLYRKAVGLYCHPRRTAIAEKRRQVPCMVGMQAIAGIVVPLCVRKILPTTRISFMNMKRKHTAAIRLFRQILHLCDHQNRLPQLIKAHYPLNVRIECRAFQRRTS